MFTFAFFLFTDEKEDTVLGSLPLLSFHVGGVEPSDNITRKFAFKVCNTVVRGHNVLGGLCLRAVGLANFNDCISF